MRWPWHKKPTEPRPSVGDLYRAHHALELARHALDLGMKERAAALIEEAAGIPGAVWPGIIQWHRNKLANV
jgi:hypothetical protein